MPGPKSGVHGLTCVDREGTASTKVVLQSRVRYSTVVRLAYAVFLPGRLPYVVSPTSASSAWSGFPVCPLLVCSACGPVLPFLGFLRGSLSAVPCGPRGSLAARGVLLLGLSLSRLHVLRSWYFVFGVHDFCILPISTWLRLFWPFFLRHFSSCGVPARWRDLRCVVSAFAASSLPSGG